jgi:hypothetical protein
VLSEATYRDITVTASSATNPCRAAGIIVVTRRLRVQPAGVLEATSATIQLSCGTRTAPTSCAAEAPGGRLQIDATGQMTMSSSGPATFSIVADPRNNSRMFLNGSLSTDQPVYGRLTRVSVGTAASWSASERISVARLDIASHGSVNVRAVGGAPVAGPPDVGLFQ